MSTVARMNFVSPPTAARSSPRISSPSASAVIRALEGSNASSSIGFQLERDTRDKIINTTSGNRVEMNFRFAGGPLGGSKINNNYSVEFRGSQFFPVFETQAQVLALIARGGVIQNFGDSNDVPYYNKYYLGGPQTLRGYEFREVAPRDPFNEPIGGKTYGFFSAEYSADIVSPIRFALFYDAGFVNRGAYDFNASKKGRLLPVKSVGEALESASAKYFKESELWVKTKMPVAVVVTDNVGPVIGVKMNFRRLDATAIKSRFPDKTEVVTFPSALVTFVLSSMS